MRLYNDLCVKEALLLLCRVLWKERTQEEGDGDVQEEEKVRMDEKFSEELRWRRLFS